MRAGPVFLQRVSVLWERDSITQVTSRTEARFVDRRLGGDVKRAQVVVTPRKVSGALRRQNHTEAAPAVVEHMYAARTRAVQVACAVDFHSVRRTWKLACRFTK